MQRCRKVRPLPGEQHVDFILAVGGGSVIDCCKVISAQALLDEDIWEMEYGKGQFPNAGIPVGAVVTASGTGAEMNAGGVITHEEKKWKGGHFRHRSRIRRPGPGVYHVRAAHAGPLRCV